MGWQKCPVCDGSGYEFPYGITCTCSVCKGQKIISDITGLPPHKDKATTDIPIDLKEKFEISYIGKLNKPEED